MITNPLLEAKYEAQRRLAEQAGHDLRKYPEIYPQIFEKLEKKYGRKLRYIQNSPTLKSSVSKKP
jgi:hypothetical protein